MDSLEDILKQSEPDPKRPRVLVDSDTVVYRAASATDGRQYLVGKSAFKYKADATKYCGKKGIDPEKIVAQFYPEPISHAYQIIKGALYKIREAALSKWPDATMEFYHTGDTNFRHEVLDDYKANRIDTHKPKHLPACKEWIENKYMTFEEPTLEADDMIGIRAYELKRKGIPYLIVSNDKDLKTIPGEHYDWVKGELFRVSTIEAMKFFYAQCIAGDNTDNIPGVDGLSINNKGTGKAQKIIQTAYEEFNDSLTSERCNSFETEVEMEKQLLLELEIKLFETALWTWVEGGPGKKGSFGCEAVKEVMDRFKKSAQCLFILHDEGKLWEPPTIKNGGNYV
jgi:hypothetical protein